jgi:two-component system, sensor histidine kinase
MISPSEFSASLVFFRLHRLFDAESARQGLELRLVPSTARIRSEPALLAQILDSLVANAIAYTAQGRILVGCRRRGEMLAFEVWDTGSGLPAESHQRLRGSGRVGEAVLESGIGLSVVARLARLMRHPIRVEAEPGRGTRIVVMVPLAEQLGVAAESNRAMRRMVVVIDDEEQVLEGLRLLLEAWHFDVVAAANEDEAIDHLKILDRRPVGIIADYRLREGRTGAEAVSRIRNLYHASIPSIIITGDSMTPRLREVRGEDVVILQKPVAAPHLHNILWRALGSPS